jgi:hypothetical protein
MTSKAFVCCGFVLALAGLTGCGANISTGSSAASGGAGVSGMVHGGQQPVMGAAVTLYAPGLTGYGSAPTVLATTTTGAGGAFTLPSYTCPTTNDILTYITSVGGDSGSGSNSALKLVAVLGPCSSLSSSTFVFISEATTVAAAYTLAPFAALSGSTTTIGTSAGNLLGLKNVLGPANNLANTTTGYAHGVSDFANMVLPYAEINTLADILAACVNTNGSISASAACGMLFAYATPPGGGAPNDTFQAALDIALNPGNNAAALYTLSNAAAPFQPTLTAAPGDFAVAIQYVGGQIYGSGFTTGLAIDAQGNAWVSNYAETAAAEYSVSEISPAGVFLSGTTGYIEGYPYAVGISIDQSGNVFLSIPESDVAGVLNSSGAVINALAPASANIPFGIAVDNRNGSVWMTDTGGYSNFTGTTVTDSTSGGVDATGSPYANANGPLGVQIDSLGNVWVANSANNTTTSNVGYLTEYTPPQTAGASYGMQTISIGYQSYPTDIAIDHANNVWTTLYQAVAEYSNSGTLLSGAGYLSNNNNGPASIMIDGLGRAFVSNYNGNGLGGSLTVFSNSGVLISTANSSLGYLANNTIIDEPWGPDGLVIDGSGDVWITGYNDLAATGFITEIIGVAAPVTTPTSVASSSNKYGVRP